MHFNDRFRWGLVLTTTLVGLFSCTNNDIDPNASSTVTPGKGSADFTKYVAIGNSLTAGYADAGLYRDGQLNSYPSILAGQFKTVGGGDFVQPLFTEAQAAGSGYLKLVQAPDLANPITLLTAIKQVAPGAVRVTSPAGTTLLTKFTSANQNLGVPGIRMANILSASYSSSNLYFERLLGDQAQSTTYLQYASDNLTGATFFSCWLGNNDALAYATSGGGTGSDALTPTALFTTNFTAIMNILTQGSRKGVVIGIPNITITPYFRTVTMSAINSIFKLLAPGTPDIPALAIQASDAPQGVRASTANDLFLLSLADQTELAKFGRTDAGTKVGRYGLDATNPLPTKFVLDAGEIKTLNDKITEFNTIMKAQADAKGVAYVDPNAVLNLVAATGGLTQNGITYTSSFIQGGVFSLDGIHLTPAGYALIANEVIKGINAKYSATIPQVNSANYSRVLLQQ